MASCVLKVHYPASGHYPVTAATKAVRTFKFVPETTVGQALARVIFFCFLFFFYFLFLFLFLFFFVFFFFFSFCLSSLFCFLSKGF